MGDGEGEGDGEAGKEVQYLQRGGDIRWMPEGLSDQGGGGRGVYFGVSILLCCSGPEALLANQGKLRGQGSQE